jgi:hypothetical protein
MQQIRFFSYIVMLRDVEIKPKGVWTIAEWPEPLSH